VRGAVLFRLKAESVAKAARSRYFKTVETEPNGRPMIWRHPTAEPVFALQQGMLQG
jgi:hypothetical protein